jgi:ferredoxin
MQTFRLKPLRVIISLLFLISITFMFVDIWHIVPSEWVGRILFFQYVPSLLKFFEVVGWIGIGFVIISIITLLFGRVYCSTVCPLGIFQDVIHYIRKKIQKRYKMHYRKPQNILRYTLLVAVFLVFISGHIVLLNLLDPYSVYGKISSNVFKPGMGLIYNFLSGILQDMNIYSVFPVETVPIKWSAFVISGIFLAGITALAIRYERLYCNTICPVGTLLGLISRFSVFKIKFDSNLCIHCNKCANVCKASCIDVKQQHIDFSRCVGCFNCIEACDKNGIDYQLSLKNNEKSSRTEQINDEQEEKGKRNFFKQVLLAFLSMPLFRQVTAQESTKRTRLPVKTPVTPPGSRSFEHFNQHCTACHLCVTVCPSNVIRPSFLEYGFKGMLQPYLDFQVSYCNYECTQCSEVCPTGAILPLTVEEKKKEQIGIARFVKNNCIVYISKTACGACAEHCPTKAVHMVPYQDGLRIPEVRPELCIGCGACEFACPPEPKAIYVEGLQTHQKAEVLKSEKVKPDETEEDFPF